MIILLAAALASAATPVAVRIDEVAARPAAFDGRWVRLRGRINRCGHFSCAICPEDPATDTVRAGKCLALDWDRQRGDDGSLGPSPDPVYRYASVEIVARFDMACITGICTDRAPVLFDARVVHVFRRRPSALGWNARPGADRMADAPPAAAAPLIALLRRADQVADDAVNAPRYRVFADPGDPAIERSAIVCRSRGKDGDPATWPIDQGAATIARSSEDKFRCFFARRTDGQWVIAPD